MKTKVNVMKKVLGFVLTLVIMCSMLPMTSNAAEGTTVYLDPGPWDVDSAWFAAYYFGGSGSAGWTVMEVENDNYKGIVPAGYTSVIFCRMNPSYAKETVTNDPNGSHWGGKWNQTSDLILSTSTNGCLYTVTGWGESDGAWSHIDANSNGACDLCDAYIDGMSAVAGHSLALDGKVGVKFYMELTDDVKADEDAYMQFTVTDGSTSQVKVDDAEIDGDYRVFTCKVAAKEMASTITAQIISGGNAGTAYTYSARTYADELLANPGSEAQATFVKAMLNYGAASQTYFGFNIGNLANEGITLAVGTYDAGDLESYKATVTDENSILTDEKANLVLESETTLNIKFTTASEASSIVLNEGATSASGLNYVIPVANLNASQLDNTQTVVVTVNGQEATITCSALSYCYSVLANDNSDNLKNVAYALYDYNKAAIAYIGDK